MLQKFFPDFGFSKMSGNIRVGDFVVRWLAGELLMMKLKVTEIDDKFIHCGDWKFDKTNGAEVDEELGWDKHGTGSYIEI